MARTPSWLALVLCSGLGVACSGDVTRLSPSSPSPMALDTPQAVSAVIERAPANAPAPGATATWAADHGWSLAADGLLVEGTDVITAVTGACPAVTITVRGVPVSVRATTVFQAPLTCAGLVRGVRVKVTGLLTFTPTGYSVAATRLAPASTGGGDDNPDNDGDGETPGGPGHPGGPRKGSGQGVIGAITGTCPSLTLIITGTRVQTTAATEYVNGSCASLRPGTQVKIDGELDPGGVATADAIEILRIPGREVSGDGPVSAVAGTCPALTLTVRGITVVTSAATTFTGGPCSRIVRGTHVDVTGEYDGTRVEATAVAIVPRGRP